MVQEHLYRYLLSFGSNLGDKRLCLETGLKSLLSFSFLIRSSPWIETAPLQKEGYDTLAHDSYLNGVVEVATSYDPFSFYKDVIIPIEDQIGHDRQKKWEPRHLDIDILFGAYHEASQDFEGCKPLAYEAPFFFVPHRDYLERPFLRELIEPTFLSYSRVMTHFKTKPF
jgi:2-amino-4-hydroxy-6-hydroxymethyldihydropteridine diphosphokinase